ncbi:hypothetical protein [Fodinicola feengrottensis]|uniref:hypothetical protein n=1 Tax=Fodinicola feengrottensis TaxID=435914 RepID=UPI0013D85C1C|nr:hypothetical protein [Fodinicola feengrottensis]
MKKKTLTASGTTTGAVLMPMFSRTWSYLADHSLPQQLRLGRHAAACPPADQQPGHDDDRAGHQRRGDGVQVEGHAQEGRRDVLADLDHPFHLPLYCPYEKLAAWYEF